MLLEVISGPPPTLEHPEAWSDAFKEFIAICTVKEPRKRKSATELLKVCAAALSYPTNVVVLLISNCTLCGEACSASRYCFIMLISNS